MNTQSVHIKKLSKHLYSANSAIQMEELLTDLLTTSELSEISKRLEIFKLLKEGKPQRQIAEILGVGIATVTRGSKALKDKIHYE